MRTNYKDFIASTENRHYRQIDNDDGTISLVDETVYTQEGDKVSAGVLNELSQNAIWPLQYAKSGTTHQLTGLTAVSGVVSCVFTATADFVAGDTLTVDGDSYTAQMPDGEAAPDKLFTSGVSVSVVVDKTGKKVNFKSAGGVKLPAGTWVIVKGYTSGAGEVSETFTAPISGTYRITVVGAGGRGGRGDADDSVTGGGGGSGGWACSTLYLSKGGEEQITCNASVSSFGAHLSATGGGDGSLGTGGTKGTATGGNVRTVQGIKGKDGVSDITGKGGNGAAVASYSLNSLLSDAYGEGGRGSSSVFMTGKYPEAKNLFAPYGAGGGGGATNYTNYGGYGKGGPGAVIIELLLKGVNDT